MVKHRFTPVKSYKKWFRYELLKEIELFTPFGSQSYYEWRFLSKLKILIETNSKWTSALGIWSYDDYDIMRLLVEANLVQSRQNNYTHYYKITYKGLWTLHLLRIKKSWELRKEKMILKLKKASELKKYFKKVKGIQLHVD